MKSNYTHLEVIGRANGEVERILLDNKNAIESVQYAADFNGLSIKAAWHALENGGELLTFGFIRRFVKATQ